VSNSIDSILIQLCACILTESLCLSLSFFLSWLRSRR
jgi:hypothetical protein